MSATSDFSSQAPIFAALGDETRLALLTRLSEGGPRSITQLCAGAKVTRQAISQHLQVLANVGLVRGMQSGRERIFQVETQRFDEAHKYLDEISRRWDRALNRLRDFVED